LATPELKIGAAVNVATPVTPNVVPTVNEPESVWDAAAMVPVKVGEAESTLFPVPVLVTETRFLEASKAAAVEIVAELNTGAAVKVATPVTPNVVPTVKEPESVWDAAAMVPVNVGEAESTLFPVPVLVTETRFLEASKAAAVEIVAELNTGAAVKVATPVTPNVVPTVKEPESVWDAAAMVPVKVGEAESTLFPVPVLVTETRCLVPSNAAAVETVAAVKIGATVNVATPLTPNVVPTINDPESVWDAAIIVPVKVGEPERTTFPAPVVFLDTALVGPLVRNTSMILPVRGLSVNFSTVD
jgi:expansin (peptidoglycan-binding protein)